MRVLHNAETACKKTDIFVLKLSSKGSVFNSK